MFEENHCTFNARLILPMLLIVNDFLRVNGCQVNAVPIRVAKMRKSNGDSANFDKKSRQLLTFYPFLDRHVLYEFFGR